MNDPNRTDDASDEWQSGEGAAVAAAVADLGRSLDALAAAVGNGEDTRDDIVNDATALVLDVPIALAMYSTQMLGLGIRPTEEVRARLDELGKRLADGSRKKHETLSRIVGILSLQAAQVHEALGAQADDGRVH